MAVAQQQASLRAMGTGIRQFAEGGVVGGSELVSLKPNSGELVLPAPKDTHKSINIFPDDGDYHCINPCSSHEE